MTLLEDALAIAVAAHRGQIDKAGSPYILHPLRMMLRMRTEHAQIAAVLHDVVEDTPWTLDGLRDAGFPAAVVHTIDCLTRRSDESYEAFVARASTDAVAREVKLADLEDNMDIRRIATFGPSDAERLARYHRAWQALTQSDQESTTRGD